MIARWTLLATAEAPAAPALRERSEIPDRFKWNLTHIFPSWDAWKAAYDELEREDRRVCRAAGHAGRGAGAAAGGATSCATRSAQLDYKVWYFASLQLRRGSARQRDQRAGASRCRFCSRRRRRRARGSIPSCWRFRWRRCSSGWPANAELAVYRFAIEDLYRQQEHVLDDKGEHLLSLVEPLLLVAERRVRGALDRRRQASDGAAVDRRRGAR